MLHEARYGEATRTSLDSLKQNPILGELVQEGERIAAHNIDKPNLSSELLITTLTDVSRSDAPIEHLRALATGYMESTATQVREGLNVPTTTDRFTTKDFMSGTLDLRTVFAEIAGGLIALIPLDPEHTRDREFTQAIKNILANNNMIAYDNSTHRHDFEGEVHDAPSLIRSFVAGYQAYQTPEVPIGMESDYQG